MPRHKPTETDRRKGSDKSSEKLRARDLRKYSEVSARQEVPVNKKMESRFKEINQKYDQDFIAVRDKKSEIIENKVSNKFDLAPEKKTNNTSDYHYMDREGFNKELKQRSPFETEKDVMRTDGFYDGKDNQAYVREGKDDYETSVHEKLHQKSLSQMDTRLNEGITEFLARKEAGWLGELKNFDSRGREIPKPRSDYEKETEVVGKLNAAIGQEPFDQAYFHGDTSKLKNSIDSLFGKGAFDKISSSLEQKDYEAASEIVDSYAKSKKSL